MNLKNHTEQTIEMEDKIFEAGNNFIKGGSKRKYTSYYYSKEEFERLNNLYENYYKKNFSMDNPLRSKELENNEVLNVTIRSVNGNIAIGETNIGQSIVIDTHKEEKAISRLGFHPISMEVGSILDVVIFKDSVGNYNGSVSQGYENSLKNELLKAIKEERSAFLVKIEELCPGGFMVNLSGIKCFLPGSLAAANRIIDFNSFVGRSIMVMVETYDERRDIFVVSFKKYLKNIINSKVGELSLTKKYTGTVTGTSSAGVFVEWDEYYTGLIPADEYQNFDNNVPFKPGEKAEFYVSDLKTPERIVLTIKKPDEKSMELQRLKDLSNSPERDNEILQGTIYKTKSFGVFVKLANGLNGFIETEDLRRGIKEYSINEVIDCNIINVDIQSGKMVLMEA